MYSLKCFVLCAFTAVKAKYTFDFSEEEEEEDGDEEPENDAPASPVRSSQDTEQHNDDEDDDDDIFPPKTTFTNLYVVYIFTFGRISQSLSQIILIHISKIEFLCVNKIGPSRACIVQHIFFTVMQKKILHKNLYCKNSTQVKFLKCFI